MWLVYKIISLQLNRTSLLRTYVYKKQECYQSVNAGELKSFCHYLIIVVKKLIKIIIILLESYIFYWLLILNIYNNIYFIIFTLLCALQYLNKTGSILTLLSSADTTQDQFEASQVILIFRYIYTYIFVYVLRSI